MLNAFLFALSYLFLPRTSLAQVLLAQVLLAQVLGVSGELIAGNVSTFDMLCRFPLISHATV